MCFSISNCVVLIVKYIVEIDGEYSLFLLLDDFMFGVGVKLKLFVGYNNV